jgi:hypothetical protein
MESGTDHDGHWALTHFLLGGHHKMQPATGTGRPVQVLSPLSVDASLATPEQVARVPGLRAQPPADRRSSSSPRPR